MTELLKRGFTMKRFICLAMAFVMVLCMMGCRQAQRVSYNVSKEADNFGVTRKLTVMNIRTDRVIMEVQGTFSIGNSSEHELAITCKTGEDSFKKHYVYLNDWTVYTVEDISGADVDPYKYEITLYPQMIPVADFDVTVDV